MFEILRYMSYFVMSIGLFLMITAVVGIIRFPDFYTRLHAAGIGDTLGVTLILSGAALWSGSISFTAKIFLMLIIIFIANTTASHVLADCCYKKSGKEN